MISPFVILALWGIAMILGVVGVVSRKKILLKLGMVAALGGLAVTFWLKSTLK
ncbi:hypothetical protein [Desulforamulus reducens]|uniref:hypothetical protein n=1 Tax=Desulforamulus reducens TaxID=59610 RepID=UPI0002E6421C|nr:hypothetical protein [Desulforamulus reducens]